MPVTATRKVWWWNSATPSSVAANRMKSIGMPAMVRTGLQASFFLGRDYRRSPAGQPLPAISSVSRGLRNVAGASYPLS
jgi:hypothetical protein